MALREGLALLPSGEFDIHRILIPIYDCLTSMISHTSRRAVTILAKCYWKLRRSRLEQQLVLATVTKPGSTGEIVA